MCGVRYVSDLGLLISQHYGRASITVASLSHTLALKSTQPQLRIRAVGKEEERTLRTMVVPAREYGL
jgi:hypothetical protein